MPGYLIPSDLKHVPTDKLARSEGAVAIHKGQLISLPTIVPQQRADGCCVFFKQGLCEIHEHSPWGCRRFNTCEPSTLKVENDRQQGLRRVMADLEKNGPYAQLWRELPEAKPRNERKKHFEALISKEEHHGKAT
jgi:Fe-S-cluster containining protein